MTSVSSSSLGPLNPGKIVSAAIRLYRDRFKTYIGLSLKASLWWLVPIYGWAKYGMIMGQMSRLAFQELINQPETARESYRAVSPKLWSFLGAGFLTGLILIGANIAISIASAILGGIIGFGLGALLGAIFGDSGTAIATILAVVVQYFASLAAQLWVQARFFIPEVPLAVEPSADASASIGRSWNLSQGSVLRIQLVVLASYLVMLPIFILGFMLFIFLAVVVSQSVAVGADPNSAVILLFVLAILAVFFGGGMLILPFLQTVKGVLYYDLRSRREGLDLNLVTDSTPDGSF